MCAKINQPEIDRQFVLAGHAIFTVSNPSGDHYTYQVRKVDRDDGRGEIYFADILTGPNNANDYSYAGVIDPAFLKLRLTGASKFTEDAKSVQVLRWALKTLNAGRDLPAGYRVHHEGYCGRCGALLTVTGSVDKGYGPVCAKKLGIKSQSQIDREYDLEMKQAFQILEAKREREAFLSDPDFQRSPFALTSEECKKIGAESHC